MQKKIVALAVAGLSTAAFAQTNVTIYGVVDVSGQGYTVSTSKERPLSPGHAAQGSVFAMTNNSSLIGFKGTEDLGNGVKALFQAETNLNITGEENNGKGQGGVAYGTSGSVFGAARDSFLGLSTKYGSLRGGYISTPMRSSLTSFDVMPGATGSARIENMMNKMKFGSVATFDTAIRATAVAYAMPTLYGFDASIAYTGSNNNGTTNTTDLTKTNSGVTLANACTAALSACSATPQSAFAFNLGWTGYGVNVKGAFQQNNNNFAHNEIGDYTTYLVGAMYTGLPGLKVSGVYTRNTLGTNQTVSGLSNGAGKLTNNQFYTGASYRMGNWEPRVMAVWSSDIDGSNTQQYGSRQWAANVGYYMSKRTQVYGLISNVNNSANQNFSMASQQSNMKPGPGGNEFTYGMGVRTTF